MSRADVQGTAPEHASVQSVTRVFGIRHHGPGSARSLWSALVDFRPDTILIEGPADADPLTGYVAAEGMRPPVALLGYVPDAPAKAAFWPFAAFSPEWQALRYAAENQVPVRFCDLPAAFVLAAEEESSSRFDPLAELAAVAGYDDAERWWDAVVESAPNTDVFAALTEAMGALREESTTARGGAAEPDSVAAATDAETPGEALPRIDANTLRREAYMRQTMRKAHKGGSVRLAVVCGAWHAPALARPLGPAAADARLLKGLPKTKVALTWVPWTHSRLSVASGYGAGIDSPGWYHHLFTETEQPIARWLTKVAGVLRDHDLPVSSAHIIEAVRLTEALAGMRARPLAGLTEVNEAVMAVMCGGDETMLRLVTGELVVGEALGAVPETTPTVPLAADLRKTIATLRMKQQPHSRTIELDLRKDRDVQRSRLLHRLRVLGIDWGIPEQSAVRNTGTFRETWALRWRPDFAITLIEAARWGTTVRTAAEAKILDVTTSGRDVGELTTAIETALLAELGTAIDGLIERLAAAAAVDHDVAQLLRALPGLIRTVRYGNVRGTDTAALTRVADGMLVRICAGLPGAVTGLDADAATVFRELLDAAHAAIHTRDDSWATGQWLDALTRLADRADVNGALIGRIVRLLCDAGRIDEEDSQRRLSAALSVGASATEKAAWIDGFLAGRGLLLVHDRNLLRLIDAWLARLDEARFTETLPLLRRTFGAFESGERRAIAHAVRTGRATTAAVDGVGGSAPALNHAHGTAALRTAREILAVMA